MIHFVASRWALLTACGIVRKQLLTGRAHIALRPSRVTCEACLRAMGEVRS